MVDLSSLTEVAPMNNADFIMVNNFKIVHWVDKNVGYVKCVTNTNTEVFSSVHNIERHKMTIDKVRMTYNSEVGEFKDILNKINRANNI